MTSRNPALWPPSSNTAQEDWTFSNVCEPVRFHENQQNLNEKSESDHSLDYSVTESDFDREDFGMEADSEDEDRRLAEALEIVDKVGEKEFYSNPKWRKLDPRYKSPEREIGQTLTTNSRWSLRNRKLQARSKVQQVKVSKKDLEDLLFYSTPTPHHKVDSWDTLSSAATTDDEVRINISI